MSVQNDRKCFAVVTFVSGTKVLGYTQLHCADANLSTFPRDARCKKKGGGQNTECEAHALFHENKYSHTSSSHHRESLTVLTSVIVRTLRRKTQSDVGYNQELLYMRWWEMKLFLRISMQVCTLVDQVSLFYDQMQ